MARSVGFVFGAMIRSGTTFIRPSTTTAAAPPSFSRFVDQPQKTPPQMQLHTRRGFRSGTPFSASGEDGLKVEVDPSKLKAVVSRKMGPVDTQMYGNVHGGVLLELIEEAGTILTMQYCNTNENNSHKDDSKSPEVITVSGCMERTDFLQPMFLGDEVAVHSEIGYTSPHSIQVISEVYARRDPTDEPRLTSRAKTWHVPLTTSGKKVVTLPPRTYADPQVEAAGKETYLRLKRLRDEVIRPRINVPSSRPEDIKEVPHDVERHTVNYSRAQTRHAIHPPSCWADEKYLRGGVAMKWMDDVGSLSASLHSSYPGFTISVDTIMFLRKLRMGAMMIVTSKPIFVSQRASEILITGDELTLRSGEGIFIQRAVEAIFTFISPDETGRPRALPPLKLKTDEEVRLFEERKKLYEERQALKRKP